MGSTQLVVSGSIALDRIMNFTGQYHELIEASKLETLSVSVLVDSLTEAPGGTGANIAYNLAALGDQPQLLGSVGPNATNYIERLQAAGVNTERVHRSQLPTASFNVLTDSLDNQVGGFYPGAMADADSLGLDPWVGQDVLICVSAHDPAAMRRQVEACRQHGLRLMYDPGQQVSNITADDLHAGIDVAEILIVNDYEVSVLSSKTGLDLSALQAKLPVLISTHGKDGSVISGHKFKQPLQIGSARPAQIADPTGAGDAYRAGFLYGYLRQWDVRQCGQLGAVVASFVLEQARTQVQLAKEQIIKRYQATFKEEVNL